MLLYYNGSFSRQLFQRLGSAFWRASTLSIGFIVALVTAGLQFNLDLGTQVNPTLPHQYPMQTLGVIVTIAIVFRTNQAWQRYWEGVTQLHFMYSKWADAFSQFCGFVSVTIMNSMENEADHKEKISKLCDMHEKVQNDFLLLSAMACDRICRGDCAQMARRAELGASWTDRIVLREGLRNGLDIDNGGGMPTFRPTRIVHRESSTLERLDDASLKGIWDAEYPVLKPPTGPKYKLLANSFDRANMVVNWLNHNLAYCSGDLAVASPIQSRMFQEISNGMLGFNNALKVADVPLAFPYSQFILILMVLWNMLIPFYVVSFTKSLIAGPILAFLLSSFMFCLNGIAAELENPFGQGANSICVPEFHSRFLLVVTDASRSCYFPPRPPKSHTAARASAILWSVPDTGVFSEALGAQDFDLSAARQTDVSNVSTPKSILKQGTFNVSEVSESRDRTRSEAVGGIDPELTENVDVVTIGGTVRESMQFVDILETARRASRKWSTKERMQAQATSSTWRSGGTWRSGISSVQGIPEDPDTLRRPDVTTYEPGRQTLALSEYHDSDSVLSEAEQFFI